MLFTVAPPVCVAKYSTKNLSDDEGGGEEEEILEVMVTSVFKNGCDKKKDVDVEAKEEKVSLGFYS